MASHEIGLQHVVRRHRQGPLDYLWTVSFAARTAVCLLSRQKVGAVAEREANRSAVRAVR